MFDPQTHTARGVAFDTVMRGLLSAMADAEARHGITSRLILCFLRHLSEEEAFATLVEAEPWLDRIDAVGLDSSENGHPPSKFARVFAAAKAKGLRLVAHAGEEGPPEYVVEALDVLGVERLDHGNRSLEDPVLTARLARSGMTLTVCPLSNLKLCVVNDMADHPIDRMLRQGLRATINSDDPAYFGGYVVDNYLAAAEARGLGRGELATLARNSFLGSFLPGRRGGGAAGAARRLSGRLMPVFATINHDQFVADVRALAAAVLADGDWRPDYLIGVGRGGLAPAVYLSHATGLTTLSCDLSSNVKDFADDVLVRLAERSRAGERLLFVDDINDSGRTIALLRARLAAAGGVATAIRFATLLDNAVSAERVEYRARTIDRTADKSWFVFPWEALAPADALAEDAAAVPERIG